MTATEYGVSTSIGNEPPDVNGGRDTSSAIEMESPKTTEILLLHPFVFDSLVWLRLLASP